MGLVKTSKRKCNAFRLWPFKKMPHTPAQCCEMDDICLVKMTWMCDKYCITENELYSLLEWFIREKMLIKKAGAMAKAPTNIQTHICAGNCIRDEHLTEPRSGEPQSWILGGVPWVSFLTQSPTFYRRGCYGTMIREQPLSLRLLWRDNCWIET